MNRTVVALLKQSVASDARANYRPDTLDAFPLLARIEAHIIARGTSPTVFGRKVVNDPSFVFELRKGRRVTSRTAKRVEAYLAKGA
ncbi:hypothetical protein [Sphingobium bisphenolivorans]|uniref:hypothetical protein n=1 Tax=Sphingobium bisphenolivorans TaxID=1335760 RepID=UPI0003A3970B|nr:hypothetical protein [Sphingobium bisphenolivorans]